MSVHTVQLAVSYFILQELLPSSDIPILFRCLRRSRIGRIPNKRQNHAAVETNECFSMQIVQLNASFF